MALWLTAYCISTEQPRYYLLLTAVHRLLAPLFTSIRTLFQTSTLPHRHDSIKTRNSACVTHFAVAIGRTPKKTRLRRRRMLVFDSSASSATLPLRPLI